MSVDPVVSEPRYSYVRQMPTIAVEPSGTQFGLINKSTIDAQRIQDFSDQINSERRKALRERNWKLEDEININNFGTYDLSGGNILASFLSLQFGTTFEERDAVFNSLPTLNVESNWIKSQVSGRMDRFLRTASHGIAGSSLYQSLFDPPGSAVYRAWKNDLKNQPEWIRPFMPPPGSTEESIEY